MLIPRTRDKDENIPIPHKHKLHYIELILIINTFGNKWSDHDNVSNEDIDIMKESPAYIYHAQKIIRCKSPVPTPGQISPDWNCANVLNDFTYPWIAETTPKMTFRALWDDLRFYFRFDVEERNVLIQSETNHKSEVLDSDRVEIFFRVNSSLNPYYCLEMDPLGRIFDYKAAYYRQFDYEWQWPGRNQIMVHASQTDRGYGVEGWLTLSSLRKLLLLQNNTLQAGLFRGKCMGLNEEKEQFRWISWVPPSTERPDFHIASSFGMILLEE
jgi:hypothetical protein